MKTIGSETLAVSCQQPFFLLALDVRDVCRLHSTSNDLGMKIIETLKLAKYETGRQLLRRVVLQASSAVEPDAATQHVGPMRWLLSELSFPGQLLVDESAALIRIPKVPFEIVELLVSAGARITYQQLTAAARSQTVGVHIWVTAQQQLGIQQEMPHTVEAVCRYGAGSNWASTAPHQPEPSQSMFHSLGPT